MEEIDAQIAQLQQKKIQILFELEVIERRRGLTKDGQHRILAKPSPSPSYVYTVSYHERASTDGG